MRSNEEDKPEIIITDADLEVAFVDQQEPVLSKHIIIDEDAMLAAEELEKAQNLIITPDDFPPIIQITEADLPKILKITEKDLPEVIRLNWKDLPKDLNGVIWDCFHGTSKAAARQIQRHGFKVGPGAAYGSGVYFSLGAIGIARSYKKGEGAIIQARVNWGRVAYLDKTPNMRGSGDALVEKAKRAGYDSIVLNSKFSKDKPTTGVVLAKKGQIVPKSRIEVVRLI